MSIQYQDQPDIENEVRRLFRADGDAVDVKWEVIYEQQGDGESKLDDLDASSTAPADIESGNNETGGGRRPAGSFAEIGKRVLSIITIRYIYILNEPQLEARQRCRRTFLVVAFTFADTTIHHMLVFCKSIFVLFGDVLPCQYSSTFW